MVLSEERPMRRREVLALLAGVKVLPPVDAGGATIGEGLSGRDVTSIASRGGHDGNEQL